MHLNIMNLKFVSYSLVYNIVKHKIKMKKQKGYNLEKTYKFKLNNK